MRTSLLLLIIIGFLSACGHKGPLVLPGDKPAANKRGPAQSTPPANAPTPAP